MTLAIDNQVHFKSILSLAMSEIYSNDSLLIDGMLWYKNAVEKIAKLASKHNLAHKIVAGIVAALSPGGRWDYNIEFADFIISEPWEAFNYAAHNPNFFTYNNDNIEKALDILELHDMSVLSGLKVVPFYHALCGLDYGLPVIDSHMLRLFGIFPRLWLRRNERTECIIAFHEVANEYNITVPQLQACAWLYQKNKGDET